MKLFSTLILALTLAFVAGAARALTIENQSGVPASVTVLSGNQAKVFQIEAGRTENARCDARCTVKLQGQEIKVAKGEHVVISAQGKLAKTDAPGKGDMKKDEMKK